MTERLYIIDEADISPELDREIRDLLCVAFPGDRKHYLTIRSWHGVSPAHTVIIERDGAVIAHVGVVDRTVDIGGTKVRVMGIQNAFVVPGQRGKGLAEKAFRHAAAEIGARGFDLGILFCVPELERVYGAWGWKRFAGERVVRVEEGAESPLPSKNIAMYLPLRLSALPEGRINLCGNDW